MDEVRVDTIGNLIAYKKARQVVPDEGPLRVIGGSPHGRSRIHGHRY